MNELTVINNETGEVMEFKDQTSEIVAEPIRLSWDVKSKDQVFSCSAGEAQEISGVFVGASKIYSCWTDQLGQPTCQGFGDKCPDHPTTSSKGIALMLDTDQFGPVFMFCYGLMYGWAQGLTRRAKDNSFFSTKGTASIQTKHGACWVPGWPK